MIRSDEEVPLALSALSDEDPLLRDFGLNILKERDTVFSALIVRLENPFELRKKQNACLIAALQSMGPSAFDRLQVERWNAEKAIPLLITIGGEWAAKTLIRMLNSPESFWVPGPNKLPFMASAASALSGFREYDVEGALVDSLRWFADRGSIDAPAGSLARLKSPKALEPLISLLSHPKEEVRGGAAVSLGELGFDSALGPLIGSMKDPAAKVRQSAAIGLGN